MAYHHNHHKELFWRRRIYWCFKLRMILDRFSASSPTSIPFRCWWKCSCYCQSWFMGGFPRISARSAIIPTSGPNSRSFSNSNNNQPLLSPMSIALPESWFWCRGASDGTTKYGRFWLGRWTWRRCSSQAKQPSWSGHFETSISCYSFPNLCQFSPCTCTAAAAATITTSNFPGTP